MGKHAVNAVLPGLLDRLKKIAPLEEVQAMVLSPQWPHAGKGPGKANFHENLKAKAQGVFTQFISTSKPPVSLAYPVLVQIVCPKTWGNKEGVVRTHRIFQDARDYLAYYVHSMQGPNAPLQIIEIPQALGQAKDRPHVVKYYVDWERLTDTMPVFQGGFCDD